MLVTNLANLLAKCDRNNFACAGFLGSQGIPGDLVRIIHYIYLAIQVIVPVLLIIFGMIELAKAITVQKEEEIKRAQGSFMKKLIVAVIIFLVFSIVRFVFYFANSDKDSAKVWGCVNQLIDGNCGEVVEDDINNNSVTDFVEN